MDFNMSTVFASIEKEINQEEILELQYEYCIYRVPRDLRKLNEEAYTPRVISIGPFHHGKKELIYMEKRKKRSMKEFYDRYDFAKKTLQEFTHFLIQNEKKIRNCYEEMPNTDQIKLFTMILYDAVFIIQLFNGNNRFPTRLSSSIELDLLLLENQLPYFILVKLFNIAFPNDQRTFFQLCCDFFSIANSDSKSILLDLEFVDIKHFTDLKRHVMVKKDPGNEESRHSEYVSLPKIPCATKLHQSGVMFKKVKGERLLDVQFPQTSMLKDRELQIPIIEIYDDTESAFRNLMALEQCCYPSETVVMNYINLMDDLIDTKEDVNLLVDAGIISNNVGDPNNIVRMFNKLCIHVTPDERDYTKLYKDLNKHYKNPLNLTLATLKRVYFTDLWRGTGTVAAVVLLLLTPVQTIYSVK